MTDKWIPLAKSQPKPGRLVLCLRLDGKLLIGSRSWWVDEDEDEDGEDGSSWTWDAQADDDSSDLNELDNPITHWRPLPSKPSRAARYGAIKLAASTLQKKINEALAEQLSGDELLPSIDTMLIEYKGVCKGLRNEKAKVKS